MDFYFEIDAGEHCPLRGFTVSADQSWVHALHFVLRKQQLPADASRQPTLLQRQVQEQVEAYFAGQLTCFDLPIQASGTPFQQMVWAQIGAIPYGETRTYAEIGLHLGDSHLARAVGNAANRNPLPLIIPCHRVVGKGGKLTGFACGIPAKAFLLDMERRILIT